MLQIRRCVSARSHRACRVFLSRDPISNVLVLGDVYAPLFRVSDVYAAYEGMRLMGVCSIYRAFSTPSVVLSTGTHETKRMLVEAALGNVSGDFISLCSPEDAHLFDGRATSLRRHSEQQMIVSNIRARRGGGLRVSRVKRTELDALNRFYVGQHSEAWTPIQFEAGPYCCIKQDGRIVSAAGVHLVTPQIAQLGNIVTDEAQRNRGYATTCTSALIRALAPRRRIVSLFVKTDNKPAIHMYEKLGFKNKRDIAFMVLRKNQS